ncbi:protogenin A-like isoform X1 [Cloeon dipterum]|uniref:protogenin A-like isoform X1 n=1 Tax=Cloeon dipterum TaxID=197152 RepID=UPI00321FD504
MASRTLLHCLLCTIATLGFARVDETEIGLSFAREPPKLVIGYKGKPLVLACAPGGSHSEGSVLVSWLVNGEPVVLSDRVSIQSNGSLAFKEIEHDLPQKSDEGNYQCKLTSSDGLSLLSKTSSVRVAVMAASFTQSPKNLSVEIGDTARLSCHIEAVPTPYIFWRRDNKTLPSHEREKRYSVLRSGVLLIDAVQESDAGVYHCIVNSKKVRIASEGAYLEVVPASQRFRPARMLSEPETVDIKVQANETLSLECEASGYPVPFLRWSYLTDNQEIDLQLHDRLGSNVLAIPNITEQHSRVYVCRATNEDSQNVKHQAVVKYNVSVLVPPVIRNPPKSLNRLIGISMIFKCEMTGIPTPNISWYKNGVPLYANDRVKLYGWQLELRNSLADDAGLYQCRGQNEAGEVWAAARLIERPGVKDAHISTPTGLKCGTVNSSSIEITWNALAKKSVAYAVHYSESDGRRKSEEATQSTALVIKDLKPSTSYLFNVIGYANEGASNVSETITCRTTGKQNVVLAPVTALQAISPTAFRVIWKKLKPQEMPGQIIAHKVIYRLVGSPGSNESYEIELPANLYNYTARGLKPAASYEVCVLSSSKSRWHSADEPLLIWKSIMMPEPGDTLPSAPEIKIKEVNSTIIKIRWTMPEENKIQPSSYRVSVWKNKTKLFGPLNVDGLSGTIKIKDPIDLQQTLTIKVQALNEEGESGPFGSIDFKPSLEHAESVSALQAIAMSSDTVKLTWEGRYGGLFRVSSKLIDLDAATYINSTEHYVLITGLKPYSTYEFSVQSYDKNLNIGTSNQTVQCQTLEAVPEPPSELNFTQSDSSSGKFTWSAPSESNGQIRAYLVYYTPAESADQPLEQWLQAPTNQTWLQVSGLLPISYVATVNASTSAGYGIAADFFKFQMLSIDSSLADEPTSLYSLRHDHILLAILCSAVFVFLILGVVIAYRLAKASRLRNHNIPHTNGNGLHHHSEGIDMMVLSSSSNIPPAQTDHLDTKGWYPTPQATGVHSNGRIPNGTSTPMLKHVHITENPRFLPRGDGKSACPSCPGPGCNSRGCPSCQVEPLLAADVTQVTVLAED